MKVMKCVCGVWCVCVWWMWMCVDMCVGLVLYCKSKSSDDIIITVSETDCRACVSASNSIRKEYICTTFVCYIARN